MAIIKDNQKVYWKRRNGEQGVGRLVGGSYDTNGANFRVGVAKIDDKGKPTGKQTTLWGSQLSTKPVV